MNNYRFNGIKKNFNTSEILKDPNSKYCYKEYYNHGT
jgi:hypothetical protein